MISIFDFFNVYSVLGCIAVLLWYYSQSAYKYWQKLNVKYLEPVPFFGNTAPILLRRTTFHDGYHKFYTALDNEPFGGIYQLSSPQLIVKDPELVSNVLIRDFKHFHDRGMRLMVNKNKQLNPMSFHLFFIEGERWRVLRQKMSPVFTSGKLKQMHDQILDCVVSLTKYIDEQLDGKNSMDVALKELFEKLTIDVIGSCAFGIECNSMKSNEKFGEMGREVFRPRVIQAIRMVLASVSPRLVNLLRVPDVKQEITDFFMNLTLDTINYRRQNKVTRADLLQLLMELQNSHVDPKFAVGDQKNVLSTETFDEVDIAANSFLFFNAGFETTANTLSFCIYELAMNQDIQRRLRSEVEQIKNKNPQQTLAYEHLKDMIYMDAVISETLRKYPIVVILNRECTEEYVIPGTKTRIPVSTQVIIPAWSIHHDEKYYPNPEVFDPERFLGDNKYSRPSGTFLTFGDGPRYCVGKRFAELEIKSALAEMILRYDFKPCAKTEIPLKFRTGSLILQTTCGTWANLEKRK